MKKKQRSWTRLDNAAKIFPPASGNRDPKVFRFSCQLFEDIDKYYLQRALDTTIKRFPFYRSILKKGLFWYYFEETRLLPVVSEESKPPCSPIYDANNKGLLFQVTYYKKRINLEVFHALSDGTGALQFIKTLVSNYLNLKYKSENLNFKIDDYDASASQMTMDGFNKYFSKVKVKRIKAPKAYRFKGEKYPNFRIGVTELIVPSDKIKALAKQNKATITEYLTALLISSIGDNMSNHDKKRPVTVSVPVNLRQYFPSKTSRNFFSVINIPHDFENQGDDFEDILRNIQAFLKENLSETKLQEKINLFASLESKLAARLLPLVIKIPSLKIASRISDKAVTTAFSNVGQVKMPQGSEEFIDMFSVFVSTSKTQITMISYGNKMAITFTSPFVNNDVECGYIDKLNTAGVDIKINTNIGDIE